MPGEFDDLIPNRPTQPPAQGGGGQSGSFSDITPEPGVLPAMGRFARGAAKEAETIVDEFGMSLPSFMQGANINPERRKLNEEMLKDRPPPLDFPERAGGYATDLGAIFAPVPGLGKATGLEKLISNAIRNYQAYYRPTSIGLAKAIPAIEKIGGGIAEGGVRGAAGGAILPGEKTGDAEAGALAGAGVKGGSAAVSAGLKAIPPGIKNTVSALAAMAAAERLTGLPYWAGFLGGGRWDPQTGQHMGNIFNQLYHANLADLAASYFEKTGSAAPQAVGAAAARIRKQPKPDDDSEK